MEVKFNVKGKERKELVMAIAEITGTKAVYKGVPTCSYEVGYFSIDKKGTLIFDAQADSSEIELLIERLAEQGFEAEVAISEAKEPQDESVGLTVQMPRGDFTDVALDNLKKLVEVKADLICKALEVKSLPIDVTEDKVSFPWFTAVESAYALAYTHFITAICEMARNQKRITVKEKPIENEKYEFRCFLLRLGFIGKEYKAERKILLRNLNGSSAFKSGVRKGVTHDAISK